MRETAGELYLRTGKMRKKNESLHATEAYGRIWIGCDHGNVPDMNMRLMCMDCFLDAIALKSEQPDEPE